MDNKIRHGVRDILMEYGFSITEALAMTTADKVLEYLGDASTRKDEGDSVAATIAASPASDALPECREAFEKWINTSEGYGLAFARTCWDNAWQASRAAFAAELVRRLENEKLPNVGSGTDGYNDGTDNAIAIIRQLAGEK